MTPDRRDDQVISLPTTTSGRYRAAAAWLVAAAALAVLPGSGAAVATTGGAGDHGAVVVPALSGDLRAHDPALIRATGRDDRAWYVFSTGDPAVANGTVQIRRALDGRRFELIGTVFTDLPAWLRSAVPGVSNIWAPDVTYHAGSYYLYYSGSTFGSNRSVIGLATNTTLDPADPDYRWVDQGQIFASTPADDFNAIDPGLVQAPDGTPYLAFGSFWSGIRMITPAWPEGPPPCTRTSTS